jgi:hypothetical protein
VPAPDLPRPGQLDLFTEYLQHPAVLALRKLDLSTMTPLEAFDTLRRLQAEAGKEGVS